MEKNALLEYFLTREKTYLFILRADDEKPNVIEINKGLDFWKNARKHFFNNLELFGSRKGFEREVKGFYALGKHLIEPALKFLDNIERLYIVPHKELHHLPFHAMHISMHNKIFHLIEIFQVIYLPSATILKFCQRKNPYRKHKVYINTPLILGAWAKDDSERYQQAVQLELDTLSNIFNSPAIDQLNASKQQFLNEASQADLLHLSCHGFFLNSADTMASSGLLLNDGKVFPEKPNKENILETLDKRSFLSAKELLNVQLNCHIVTLSACETGKSENISGDELIGLSRALLYAGTPSILLTLWSVNVESKLQLMKYFYNYWQSNMQNGKSKALQKAQIELLNSDKFNSLYHWGAYILIGDWI